MIGKPKFNYEDIVEFEIDGKKLTGEIQVIDRWGTFFDDSDVSYDILVKNDPKFGGESCLYKHISEKCVKDV